MFVPFFFLCLDGILGEAFLLWAKHPRQPLCVLHFSGSWARFYGMGVDLEF